jgi:hypothetical protein
MMKWTWHGSKQSHSISVLYEQFLAWMRERYSSCEGEVLPHDKAQWQGWTKNKQELRERQNRTVEWFCEEKKRWKWKCPLMIMAGTSRRDGRWEMAHFYMMSVTYHSDLTFGSLCLCSCYFPLGLCSVPLGQQNSHAAPLPAPWCHPCYCPEPCKVQGSGFPHFLPVSDVNSISDFLSVTMQQISFLTVSWWKYHHLLILFCSVQLCTKTGLSNKVLMVSKLSTTIDTI